MFRISSKSSFALFRSATRNVFTRIQKHNMSKMVERIDVNGYDNFKSVISGIPEGSIIYVYFGGNRNDQGVSWCPDCASAEPIILSAVNNLARSGSVFLFVQVGDRPTWKDSENPFRTDKEIWINKIPTLVQWKTGKRLVLSDCENSDLLEKFFK